MEKMQKGSNSVVKNTGLVVAGAAATKLLEVGCIPLILGMVAFVVTTLWIVKSVKAGKGNLTRKAKCLMVALAAISMITLIYGIYHKLNCHNLKIADEERNEVVAETTPDFTEEKPVEEKNEEVDEATVDAGEVVVAKKTRGYCPAQDKIQATYESNKETTRSNTEIIGNEILKITSSDNESKKQDEEIAKDVENGREKKELSDGIIATTDKITEEKSDNEDSNEEKATMDKNSGEEVKSEEDKRENKTEDKNSDETKAEEVKSTEDDELDNMLNSSEVIEVTPEAKLEESNAKEEFVEEVKPEEKAVTVEAIDGYVGNINSTMQFKISGTNVEVEGLDGIDYTFNNGILNVNTGAEATVLTVEVSNSVNTVSFDIVINGVVK